MCGPCERLSRRQTACYRRPIDQASPRSSSPELAALPLAVAHAVRVASVPAAVRVLFSRLPEGARLEGRVGADPLTLPLAARQLIKLALIDDALALGPLEVSDAPVSLRLSLAHRTYMLGPTELDGDFRIVLRRALLSLLPADKLADVLETFAADAARLSALHTFTRLMLAERSLPRALAVMLAGITSGQALGLHRAAIFVRDEASGGYRGAQAVGPADAAEAHRIWEAIEVEEKSIEQIVADIDETRAPTGFERRVQEISLQPSDVPGDELRRVEHERRAMVFRGKPPENMSLRALDVQSDILICPIVHTQAEAGTPLRAMVVCDNRYGGGGIGPDAAAAIAALVSQANLVWENLALLEHIEALARTDALTGVASRRELEARLSEERARALRTHRPLSLLMLDVDAFKSINDVDGHAAGDAVLRALGAVLAKSVRVGDHVGRWGGDEFVMVLPEAQEEQASAVALRIGQAAWAAGISVSLGGASWPRTVGDVGALMQAADAALYRAKRAGRRRGIVGETEIGPFDQKL